MGFSFLPRINSFKETPFTLMTFHLTPGRSPIALPFAPPIPSTVTESCSSIYVNAPSPGKKAVITLPFFRSWTRTHFRIALLGCLLSRPTFSRTIPSAAGDFWRGSVFLSSCKKRLFQFLSFHRSLFFFDLNGLAAYSPRGLLVPVIFDTPVIIIIIQLIIKLNNDFIVNINPNTIGFMNVFFNNG